jgi:CheY-like chemotaxis protein/HPt (histidine-containing phosphotransfer) domain-containing protein
MRKYTIKHRILLLSSLPVAAAVFIFILAAVPILGYKNLIIAICLTLLMLSLALYFAMTSMQKITAQQREPHGHDAEAGTNLKHEPVANISQELRIPLNSIIGFTNLLLQTDLSGKQVEYLNSIQTSSESLLKIVNGILDNSKTETGTIDRAYERFGVLAVDDNQVNLRLVCTLLEDLGIEVKAAHSGEEAVRYASETHFDLILMDVQMPGMDGIEAMKRIHDNEGQGQKTPVVALTAHSLPDEIMQLLDAGMDDYAVKPISEQQLRAKLDKWVKPEVSTRSAVNSPDKVTVDWELCLRLANNKPDLAQELLAILRETLPDDQMSINNAVNTENTDLLQQHVHGLKGAIKYCGVPGLHEAVEQFDVALKAGDSILAGSTLEVLNDEINLFMDWWDKSENLIQ